MDLSAIRKFVSDSRVQYCTLLGESHNLFEIVGLSENKHSNILAWLFNPRESHGLGDLFFQELLRQVLTAYENSEGINRDTLQINEFFEDWDAAAIEEASFKNSLYVGREYRAGDYGRIDIFMIDHFHKIVVVIENKNGSPIHSNQLFKYYQYLQEKTETNFEDYYLLFVYLDPLANEKDGSKEKSSEYWIRLNYEWIQECLYRVIDRNILPPKYEYFLSDYSESLAGEEYEGEAFEDIDDYVSDLIVEHAEVIEFFKYHKVEVDGQGSLQLSEMSVIEMAEALPLMEIADDQSVTKIYMKYEVIIDHLIFTSKMSYFEKIIAERCPGFSLDFGSGDNWLIVYNNDWERFASETAVEEERWGFYVEMVFDETDDNRTISLKILIISKNINAEYHEPILKILHKNFNFKKAEFSKGYNTIKVAEEIENEAEAIDKLIAVTQKLSKDLQMI